MENNQKKLPTCTSPIVHDEDVAWIEGCSTISILRKSHPPAANPTNIFLSTLNRGTICFFQYSRVWATIFLRHPGFKFWLLASRIS